MNGYITVNLGGEERALKFNMIAMQVAIKAIDWDNYSTTANYAYIWGGLVGYYYAQNKTTDGFPLQFDEVCDWIDELSDEVLMEINTVLVESNSYKRVERAGEKLAEMISADEKKNKPMSTASSVTESELAS